VGIVSSDAVSYTRLFKSQCFYDNIVFFSDFPTITASYFITNRISIKLKYNFVRGQIKQDAQLSQRDRAARCVIVLAKVGDWNWETYLRTL